ncbi:MAG: SURF1 family protein, partial [Actinomycetota bacterium]
MNPATRRLAALGTATAVVVAACAGLGVWQLARRADRRAFNARLLARTALPVVTPADVPPLPGGRDDPAAYRRVVVRGTYDPDREVVLRARSLDGRAGNHVLTPLQTAGGRAFVVDRGWVPLEDVEPPVAAAPPPAGQVSVTGILVPTEPRQRVFGPRDPPEGTL